MTATRNRSANGSPNRKRTWVAPAGPSVAVSSRWVALRTVWPAAAITVNNAQSQLASGICCSLRHARACRGHPRLRWRKKNVDARHKAGHDGVLCSQLFPSLRLGGGEHVVHVHVAGELPAVGEKIVDDAGLADQREAALLERDLELVRGHELVPLMRAARQPAQHVFGPDDREREALERAVDGGDDH